MLIQITAGVYGHNVNGRVKAVRAGDPPIEVADAIGERLVKAGVAAELVNEIPAGAVVIDDFDPAEEVEGEEPAAEFPDYNADMTRAQLEEIGVSIGLDAKELKEAKNKAAVIAMLDDAKADFEAEGDAPDFDPAAAIQ